MSLEVKNHIGGDSTQYGTSGLQQQIHTNTIKCSDILPLQIKFIGRNMERGSTLGYPTGWRCWVCTTHSWTMEISRVGEMLDGQKMQQHAAVWGNRNFHTGPNIDHSWVIFGKHSPSQLSGLKIALFCRYPLVI